MIRFTNHPAEWRNLEFSPQHEREGDGFEACPDLAEAPSAVEGEVEWVVQPQLEKGPARPRAKPRGKSKGAEMPPTLSFRAKKIIALR